MSSLLALPLLWAQAGAADPAARDVPEVVAKCLALALPLRASPRSSPAACWAAGSPGSRRSACSAWWAGSAPGWSPRSRNGYLGRGRWYDFVALVAVIVIPVTVLLRTLEAAKQVADLDARRLRPACRPGRFSVPWSSWLSGSRSGIWRTIRRFGRYPDILVLVGIHLALVLGLAVGLLMQRIGILPTLHAQPEDDLERRARLRRPARARPTWATSSCCGSSCSSAGAVRGPRPPALLDRPAERLRGQPEDVGPLGRRSSSSGWSWRSPTGSSSRRAPPRWGGSSSAR